MNQSMTNAPVTIPPEFIKIKNIIKDTAYLANIKKQILFSCHPDVCKVSIVIRTLLIQETNQIKYIMLLIPTTFQQMASFLP